MAEMTRSEIMKKRRGLLAASAAAMFLLGLIYAFSMFATPISTTFHLNPSDVSLTFNIAMIATALGTLFGSALDIKFGLRLALFATGLLSLVGFAGTSVFGSQNLMAVYVFYGGIAGLAAGMGNNLIVATTNLWFPEKVGFSSGVMMTSFSFSALFLGNIALQLMRAFGLELVFVGIGILTFLVVLLLALMLHRPQEDIVALLAPAENENRGKSGDSSIALKSPVFYVYWCWAAIVFAIGMATIGNCSSDAQLIGIDTATATLLVGFVSAGNGLARLFIGMLYDKSNIKLTMFVDTCIAVLATGCITASFLTGSHLAFIVGALCCGFCYGGVPVVAAAFARKRFGQRQYPLNLSLANLAMIYGSVINVVIQGAIGTSRMPAFATLTVLSLVAMVLIFPFSRLWNHDMAAEKTRAVEN